MLFNRGYKCEKCGPIQKANKKTIAKIKRNVCPECDRIVTEWVRPLNERAGRCNNCAGAAFTLAVVKRQLLRCCKNCGMVINTDDNEKIIREGRIQ